MLPLNKRKVVNDAIENLINSLRYAKPDDRSELDRKIAIAITDAEKLNAYIKQEIVKE